jgi:hypothetical protein
MLIFPSLSHSLLLLISQSQFPFFLNSRLSFIMQSMLLCAQYVYTKYKTHNIHTRERVIRTITAIFRDHQHVNGLRHKAIECWVECAMRKNKRFFYGSEPIWHISFTRFQTLQRQFDLTIQPNQNRSLSIIAKHNTWSLKYIFMCK